jgi:hypothetical protein
MDASANTDATTGVAERLRAFLRTLPKETCGKILEALERAALAGESFPAAGMITAELTSILSAQRRKGPRVANPQRHFFAILEPFLIEETLPEKRIARIERASLSAIWSWLSRDLAPAEVAKYERGVVDAILGQDAEKARGLTVKFQKAIIPSIRAALGAGADEAVHRKLVAQIGGLRPFEDLRELVLVLENRDALKTMAERIVGPIRQLDDHHASFIVGALGPYAKGGATLMPYAVAIAMSKLAVPSQIVRVAALAAESHEGVKIASTPFSVVVDILLADVERLIVRAETARQAREVGKLAAAAKDFAVTIRALVSDLDLAPEQGWAKRAGALRSRMAQLLRPEIETLPARVRRVLKSRAPELAGRAEAIDVDEVAAIEAALDILLIAKSNAAELALNEVTLRVFTDLQAFLYEGVNPLLDGMRAMTGEDRAYRLLQLDAAVKIAYRILGASYATLLSKAVDVAAGERRQAARPA